MLRKLLFVSLFLTTLYFLKPSSVAAQSFGCVQAGISEPCVLDTSAYGCPNTPYYTGAAQTYCNAVPGSECFPISPLYPCSDLPTPTPTPTPVVALPPCPAPYFCLSNPDLCENVGGIVRNNQYSCTPSVYTCCDRTGIPTPTPTIRPTGIPTPTPSSCTSNLPPCDTTRYFVCPGTSTCCEQEANCPPPDPLNLPLCNGNNDCQVDWNGGGGGFNVARSFDMYRNCVIDATTNVASCKFFFCDGGGGMYTALGCLPFKDVKSTISLTLTWAIGISGGIALIILVYAAFLLMFSFGDPKRVQLGKELALSTIMSIFFIVLSLVILNFIGANVLNLGPLGFSV